MSLLEPAEPEIALSGIIKSEMKDDETKPKDEETKPKDAKTHSERQQVTAEEYYEYLLEQRHYYQKLQAAHYESPHFYTGRKRRHFDEEGEMSLVRWMFLFVLLVCGTKCLLEEKESNAERDLYAEDQAIYREYDYSQIRRETMDSDQDSYLAGNTQYRRPKYGRTDQQHMARLLFELVSYFNPWTIAMAYYDFCNMIASCFTVWTVMGSVFWLIFLSALYEYFERMYRCVEKRIQQGPLYVRPRYSTTNLIRKPEKPLLKIRVKNPCSGAPAGQSEIQLLEIIEDLDKTRKQTECQKTRKMICSKIERLEKQIHEMLNDPNRFERQSEGLFFQGKLSAALPFVDNYAGKRSYKTLLPPIDHKSLSSSSIISKAEIGLQVEKETQENRLIIQQHAAGACNETSAFFEDHANSVDMLLVEAAKKNSFPTGRNEKLEKD